MGRNRMMEAAEKKSLFYFERDGSLWKFHQFLERNFYSSAYKISQETSNIQDEVLTWE